MLFFYLFRNSEGAIRGHQFMAVLEYFTIVFRHTNELRNYALTTHNNESSLFAALNVWFGAARLVVFRLVGCLRRNGLARY